MAKRRRKQRPILDDAALEQDRKMKDHQRREAILDAIADVVRIGVYVAGFFAGLFVIAFGVHLIVIGDWAKFEELGIKSVLTLIGFYLGQTLAKRSEK